MRAHGAGPGGRKRQTVRACTLSEASASLAEDTNAHPLAGGQSPLLALILRLAEPHRLMHLSRLEGSRVSAFARKELKVGAMGRFRPYCADYREDPFIRGLL